MAVNLNGIWTNQDPKDQDSVIIIHQLGRLFILGFNSKQKQNYKNFGFAKVPENLDIDDTFEVTWTDTYNSKGKELGIVHQTSITIRANNILEKKKEVVVTKTYKTHAHQTSYGNWKR